MLDIIQELKLDALYRDSVVQEFVAEIGNHIDTIQSDIDRIEKHLGIDRFQAKNINELNQNVLKSLLKQHRNNLNYLRQQAALYGLSPPLEIHNKIIETEAEIERIVNELRDMT